MPFVAKHQTTGELFSCTIKNIYDIPYHGVKVWDDREEAEAELAAFLTGEGVDETWHWLVYELDDQQIRLCNVRLNNNKAKRLFLTPEGKMEAR